MSSRTFRSFACSLLFGLCRFGRPAHVLYPREGFRSYVRRGAAYCGLIVRVAQVLTLQRVRFAGAVVLIHVRSNRARAEWCLVRVVLSFVDGRRDAVFLQDAVRREDGPRLVREEGWTMWVTRLRGQAGFLVDDGHVFQRFFLLIERNL